MMDSLWVKANRAYVQERYEEAILYYDSLLKEGWIAPELYYNMGNAHFRLGRNGWALAMFKKSLEIRNDRRVRHNINMVYRRLGNPRRWPPPVVFLYWWQSYLRWTTPRRWMIGALLMGIIAAVAFWVFLWTHKPRWGYVMAVAGLLHLWGLVSAWGRHRQLNANDEAIVVVPSTLLYAAPSTGSTGLITLYEGDEVHITDKIAEWYEVTLPEGARGWVWQDAVAPI